MAPVRLQCNEIIIKFYTVSHSLLTPLYSLFYSPPPLSLYLSTDLSISLFFALETVTNFSFGTPDRGFCVLRTCMHLNCLFNTPCHSYHHYRIYEPLSAWMADYPTAEWWRPETILLKVDCVRKKVLFSEWSRARCTLHTSTYMRGPENAFALPVNACNMQHTVIADTCHDNENDLESSSTCPFYEKSLKKTNGNSIKNSIENLLWQTTSLRRFPWAADAIKNKNKK